MSFEKVRLAENLTLSLASRLLLKPIDDVLDLVHQKVLDVVFVDGRSFITYESINRFMQKQS